MFDCQLASIPHLVTAYSHVVTTLVPQDSCCPGPARGLSRAQGVGDAGAGACSGILDWVPIGVE